MTVLLATTVSLFLLGTIRNKPRLLKLLLRVSGDCACDRRMMLTDGLLNRRP
jgi:hypothetical protein